MRKNKGITLIALVVTIIVLLILAGVAINLTIGDDGIFKRAQESVEIHEEAAAREKLELALDSILLDKIKDASNYNKNEYVDSKLAEQGMVAIGDIVIVDGWQFEIDRDKLIIKTSIGKGEEKEDIQLAVSAKASDDYVKSTISLQITYSGTISEILISGNSEPIPTVTDGVYSLTKDVTENGKYTIVVKDENGNYRIDTVEVSDITEDMDIYTKADMELFRNKVNEGRTFEGRTVRVMADIDLNPEKYTVAEDGTVTFASDAEQWTPIADYGTDTSLIFKGTFNGQNHTISNIYINSINNYQGLFGVVAGNISNTKITGNIKGYSGVGALCGAVIGDNITITNCKSSVTLRNDLYHVGGMIGFIDGASNVLVIDCENKGMISASHNGGGIVGAVHNSSNIDLKRCKNTAVIQVANNNGGGIVGIVQYNAADVVIDTSYNTGNILANVYSSGGILGCVYGAKSTISNCYNIGTIEAKTGSLGGIVGNIEIVNGVQPYAEVSNCYNIGTIIKNGIYGGIVGWHVNTSSYKANNNYWLSDCGAIYGIGQASSDIGAERKTEAELKALVTTLGEEYISDANDINNGYPILKWQT